MPNLEMEAKLFKMMKGYILSLEGNIDDVFAISDKQLAEDHLWHLIDEAKCDEMFDELESVISVVVEIEFYDPLPPTRQSAIRPKLDDGYLILKKI